MLSQVSTVLARIFHETASFVVAGFMKYPGQSGGAIFEAGSTLIGHNRN